MIIKTIVIYAFLLGVLVSCVMEPRVCSYNSIEKMRVDFNDSDSLLNELITQYQLNVVNQGISRGSSDIGSELSEFEKSYKPLTELSYFIEGTIIRTLEGKTSLSFDSRLNSVISEKFENINLHLNHVEYDAFSDEDFEYYFSFDRNDKCENLYRMEQFKNELLSRKILIVKDFFYDLDDPVIYQRQQEEVDSSRIDLKQGQEIQANNPV